MFIDNLWKRPKTTRRYLHPGLSDRLAILWAEGKITLSEYKTDLHVGRIMKEKIYARQMACGIWPVWSENNNTAGFNHALNAVTNTCKTFNSFDFKQATNTITEDGTPIHGITYQKGTMRFSIEAFCNKKRKSTVFGKVCIENTGDTPLNDTVSFLMRTTMERDLCGGPDHYCSYNPHLEDWLNTTCIWYKDEDIYTDDIHQLTFSIPTTWNTHHGCASIKVDLAPGEKMQFTFKLDCGEVSTYDYAEERAKTIAFWSQELSRINKLPAAIIADCELHKAVRHMVAQLLQLTVYTTGGLVIPRQGGLQRAVWPTEALSHIEGLCRVGDFDDYLEPIFATYFDHMQLPTGEIGPLGIYWGSMTASVLYSFAQYCNTTKNKAFFASYRDKAYKAFHFMKDLRRSVVDSEDTAGGLFPILRGIDWSQQFQCWTSTDVFNLLGLDAIADTFKAYGDPAADEMRQEHTEYLADMKRHFKKYYDAQAGSDELRIPLKPKGDDKELVEDFYPLLYQGRFVFSGIIDNEKDMLRVYKQMLNTGVTREGLGLYGHMPYRDGNNNIWYLSFPDIYWFEIWMQYGYREKAKEIVDAQLRYAMSEEYYFAERIDAKDPYYVPWSPNASATGRMLIMLSKFYA